MLKFYIGLVYVSLGKRHMEKGSKSMKQMNEDMEKRSIQNKATNKTNLYS